MQTNQVVTLQNSPSGHQSQAELFPIKEVEVDGVQMGVLSDGTPYLTMRGLARMCGIDHSVLNRLANNWQEERLKPRGQRIAELLAAQGHSAQQLYLRTQTASGEHAYTDGACMAILEYYAFESTQGAGSETALRNYRLLARGSFRQYIYSRCGYDPSQQLSGAWRQFHDRVSLNYNAVPASFFSVFKEISDLIVHLGQAGLHIDSTFVPDISVGQVWAKHWTSNGFDGVYGARRKFEHNFPDYFPQAASNPQEPWCYPEGALGEFRRWFRESYVGEGKFAHYLATKVQQKQLPPAFAKTAIESYKR